MALSTAQGFIGSGDLYLQPYLPGGNILDKRVDVGNATKFSIKPNSDVKNQNSKKRDTYGSVLETVALQQPAELAITIETVNLANLRYCFMGVAATYAQTAATVTAEAFLASLDGWVQLANEQLADTGVVIKKGATVLVENTDYVVNRRLGWVKVLSTNTQSVADADPLTAGYTAQAFTGAAIRGNVQPQIRAIVTLDGLNQVDKSVGILRVWEAVLTTTSEFDWFKDDFNTIDLGGSLKIPVGYTEPFRYYTR